MARGGVNVYVRSAENPRNLSDYGTRNRAEEVAANKSVASGGDVNEAIGRLQNAGGGTLRVPRGEVGRILGLTPFGVMQAKDGTIIVQDTRFGGKRDAVTLIKPNGERESVGAGKVSVDANGVETIKFGNGSSFVVQRTRVDVTKNQKDGVLSINLPTNLRGGSFDKAGNLNGWKINPKAFTDKAVRAFLYKNMSKDGVLRFPADSPVAAKLTALVSKAGYGRIPVGEINRIFNETEGARYRAGDKAASAGGLAGFGAAQRIANERAG
jgi:hypothetical protein